VQYMLLIHSSENGFAALTKEQVEQAMGAYTSYSEALRKAGVLVSSNRLQPVAASTTVHIADGKTQVLNGPYAETKEQIGGYYLIEAPDLDGAIAWASRCPGASHGTVEIRPVWSM
jgi:hypothetical protein